MKRHERKAISLLLAILVMPLALLLSASESEGEEILLKYKATVLEETKDYVIIKFQKRDIGLVTERGKPAETSQLHPNLDTASSSPGQSSESQLKAELKNEILQELRGEIHEEGTKGIGPIAYGSVEGRVVRRGVGMPEVRVKLVRRVEESSVLGIFKELKKGTEFETTTDQDGRYGFQKIPVGTYELKWLPRGSDSWIRRLTERPDVRVVEGKAVTARPIELSKPVLE